MPISIALRDALRLKSLRRNTLANLGARLVTAALAFAAIPILFAKLGPEAYGLVGLAVTLESLFVLLDLGLSTTINREIALNTGASQPPETNRDVLRTLETVYWPIGLLILSSILAASGWLATSGLNNTTLPNRTIHFCFVVLALTLAVRWPMSLYAGVLRGLQAQLLLSGLQVMGAVTRLVGGVIVVVWVSPTIQAFFLTDLIGSLLQVALIAFAAWRALPAGARPARFRPAIVRSIWRFALAFNAIAVLSQILFQSGILFVAKLLPLEDVGMYSIAASLAGVVVYIPYALVDAVFPRFTEELERDDLAAFGGTYRRALLTATFGSLTVALPVVLFSKDLLLIWTRSPSVAAGAAGAASLMAAGNLLYALWATPYTALLAAGNVRLPLALLAAVVPLALVALPFAIAALGMAGAASVWACSNAVFLFVYPFALERSVSGAGGLGAWKAPAAFLSCGVGLLGGLALITQRWPADARLVAAAALDVALASACLLWAKSHVWREAKEGHAVWSLWA